MRRLFLLPLLLAFAAPAPAQEWRMAPEYDVLLTSYDISPEVIHLKAGEPVRLRFVNNSHQSHDFSARAFFRSARLRGGDAELARGGSVRVPPLSTRTIALVPQPGRYRAGSRNRFHRLLGFTGTIVVE
jgi:plastocyanin